jgi:hypothetical protein
VSFNVLVHKLVEGTNVVMGSLGFAEDDGDRFR